MSKTRKTTLTIENIDDVKEVKICWEEMEVNELLKKGWHLMSAHVAHKDSNGFQCKPCFIVIRK